MIPPWVDRSLYPFEPKRIQTAAAALSVVDEGQGEPILFIHGTPTWSFDWRHLIQTFKATHRCIAPDLVGFGLSERPQTFGYTIKDQSAVILELLRSLDLRDVTLVVHDFGGPIGLGAALHDLGRIRRIAIFNSWMWGLANEPRYAKASRFIASPIGRFLYRRLNASPKLVAPSAWGDKQKLTKSIRAHWLGPFPDYDSRLPLWTFGVDLAGSHDFCESLWARRAELFARPTALIWGLADTAFRPEELARFKASAPNAQVTELAAAGHWPHEEEPEACAVALKALLSTG